MYYNPIAILVIGPTDERTVEPTPEIDDRQHVPEPTVDRTRVPFKIRRRPVAAPVLSAGLQLRGLPKEAGHRQRVAGERDRQVA